MSRSWSPTKLIETIVINSATPGKILIQKSPEYMYSKPFPIRSPRDGSVIGNGFEYMYSGDFWISIFPGVALLITIVSINLVGDQLRDMFNPRLQK